MFLVAITSSSITSGLRSFNVQESGIGPLTATVVTDGFLSRAVSGPDGFSVIESPLTDGDSYRDIVFSEAVYRKEDNIIEVFKSTMSGRPVYYHINPDGEFFCSSHIRLLRKAGVAIEEDTEALPEFFVCRYVTPPRTLYRNIYQLTCGSRLTITLDNGGCKIKSLQEYVPAEEDMSLDSYGDIVREAGDILSRPVAALSAVKDKLAVLLSGGVDSSILFGICQKQYGTNDTYSTEYPFEDPSITVERDYAGSAAAAYRTNHTHYRLTNNDYYRGFIEAIAAAEEPLHHLQSVLFYVIFKDKLPPDKNIVISGEGAEGPFGWAPHLRVNYFENRLPYRMALFYPLRKMLGLASDLTGRMKGLGQELDSYARNDHSIENPSHIIWAMGVYGDEKWVMDYFNVNREAIIASRYQTIAKYRHRSIYDLLSILNLYGEDAVSQTIWSKIGEANQRVLYYPYSDQRLIDFAYSIPWSIKLSEPKHVLRGIARQLDVPEFILTRRKSGFPVRRRDWAKRDGALEPLVPVAAKVFDEKQIRNMQSVDPGKAMTFWNILNYSIWKRLCINNEPPEVLLGELD